MRKYFLIFLILFYTTLLSFAQTAVLEIGGIVETAEGKPLSGAVVELYEGNSKVKSNTTTGSGVFSLTLEYGRTYKIVVSKPGMIQKRIDFNTNIPVESQRKLIKEFSMTLVDNCEGANTSVFEEPVDIVEYDNNFGNFVSNRDYFQKMQARIMAAYKDIERCMQQQYNDKKKAADDAMKAGNFEEAKKLYEDALKNYPNDVYFKRQVVQADKNLGQKVQAENKYEQLIKEADQFLAQNQLTAAKQRFAEAQKIKTGESLPQQKIKEIDNILAKQAELAKQEQAVNTQYNDLLTKANAAMATRNFPVAQQLFEQASKLKPNDPFPAQKIAEAQQAMQKQEQEKQEQEKSEKAYRDILAQAQAAMQKADYTGAQQLYQQALTFKPNEALPRQGIVEAQKLEALKKQKELDDQKAEVERSYNEAIQKANGLLAQKEYQPAINAYKDAMLIKPSDKYAQTQITKVQNLLVEEQQKQQVAFEQAYSQAMALGDAKKLNKEYEAAITAYQQALQAKPNDGAAQNKLAESQKLMAAQQSQLKEETERKAKYNQLVQEGDGLYKSQNYSDAKLKYQQALAIYPQEVYPKNQIASIDNFNAKTQKEAEYNRIITQADQLMAQQKYDDSKAQYALAMQVMPEKTYPLQKINEINALVAELVKQDIQNRYDQIAAQAEQQISQKNFEQAKALYAQAQQVMPENPYPKRRINEINAMIDEQGRSQKEAEYNRIITQADQLMAQQKYDDSKAQYALAMQVMPEKTYPLQKINEINSLIAVLAKQDIQNRYDQFAAQAEQQVSQKNFEQAKALYSQAQQVMPENPYPKRRINEINAMIDEQGRSQKEAEYNRITTQADQLMAQQKYDDSKAQYALAMQVMPEKTYPLQKINEINSLLAEAARIEREKLDKQALYDKTVLLADKHLSDKNFILARQEYTNALNVFPSEQYPKTKIEEIEQQLALLQQEESKRKDAEQKFSAAIAQADELFKNKKYIDARGFYKQANEIKPADVHSASQVKRIDAMLAQMEAEQKMKVEADMRYNELIANADNKFGTHDYKAARQLYLNALEVKPNETYPREQVKKADERLKILAKADIKQVTTESGSTTAGSTKISDLSFKNESEREKYLASLKEKYPEGITLEIYKEGNKTTKRYIVVRSGEVHEFREIAFTWGGQQYSVDGKPTNLLYLQSQVKPRTGESFVEKEM